MYPITASLAKFLQPLASALCWNPSVWRAIFLKEAFHNLS
uniref:Uncharacterized protein n=1 Tax=Arundo donax TaxID=35708 RepID=A0A0A9H8C0_ARUDO